MSEPISFFLTGPTYVRQDVRQAMTRQPVAHRGAEFKALYEDLDARLPAIFRTSRPVYLASSSSSLSWDIAVVSAVCKDVLCLTNGAFSERFLRVARSWGKEADQIAVPWGEPIDPELVRQALRRKKYEAVTLAHNETSTGVLSPLAEIAEVVREESDALIFVDAVSSLAGCQVETEQWGIDFLFTGAQKALALPPGLAFITVSERLLEKAKTIRHRGYYTDILEYDKKHRASGPITTPAMSQIWALDKQLERLEAEGIEARWQRHLDLRKLTEAWAAKRGFTYASKPSGASPTVSCLRPPLGLKAPDLVKALAERGFTVAGGYGAYKLETFRIGHMGEVQSSDLERLFEAIDDVLP